MFWLFAVTAFLTAALLFLVQPLAGKLLLPIYGGAPAVWTTTLLFFQTALLAGYAVAHVLTRRTQRRLGALYMGLVMVAALTLPLTIDRLGGDGLTPVASVLLRLAAGVGLPFVVLSAASPLLQRAYAVRRPAEDPYVLYAASNAGSFLGLLAYPFLLEPLFSATANRVIWSVAFVLAFLLLGATVGPVRLSDQGSAMKGETYRSSPRSWVVWAGLAALPVSLLLGTTTFMTTDVAAVPLLWVAPLALYLLTFVVAFGPRSGTWSRWATRASLPLGLVGIWAIVAAAPLELEIVGLLALFGALSLAIHGELYRRRPGLNDLTAFYLAIATGGALGGMFNAILAPVIFPTVLEFPLAVGLALVLVAAVLRRPAESSRPTKWRRAAILLLVPVVLVLAVTEFISYPWSLALLLPLAAILALRLPVGWNPTWLAAGLAILALVPTLDDLTAMVADRSFFGSYRIVDDADSTRNLFQGTTLHGAQDLNDPGTPLTYYHPDGPVGDLIQLARRDDPVHIGVVGLGAGSIAAYGDADDTVTFHEIDPFVIDVARDEDLFTYLSDAEAEIRIVLGDGRLTLAEVRPGTYDLLILDAFSSDAVPAHLLTTEAFSVYERALTADGVLGIHISNRHLELAPVVQAGAKHLDLPSAIERERNVDGPRIASVWAAVVKSQDQLQALDARGWDTPAADRSVRWTDDYSNILSVLK